MSLENVWRDIPLLENGEFDLKKIAADTVRDFWKQIEVKTAKDNQVCSSISREECEKLYTEIQSWVTGSGSTTPGNSLEDFLYAGDPSLKQAFAGGFKADKCGLSAKLALSIKHSAMLRSLFYYYCHKYANCSNPYNRNAWEKYYFAQNLIENVRALLKDIWQEDLEKICFLPIDNKGRWCLFEVLFREYTLLKTPVRKVRLNRLLEAQHSLPEFEHISEKVELLKSISEKDVKTHHLAAGAAGTGKLSALLQDTFSPVWKKHLSGTGVEQERNGNRINQEIAGLLDNLTFGELHDSEKMKNKESGEKGRAIRREMNQADPSDNRRRTDAVMRMHMLRSTHESLDKTDETGRSGYDKLELWEECGVYCPEDVSCSVWHRLGKNEKIFLYTYSVCKALPSIVGYKGILQMFLDCKISYVELNITRAVMECLLSVTLPEIKSSNKDSVMRMMKKLMTENDCRTDVQYNLNMLYNCRFRSFVQDGSSEFSEMSEIAENVYQQLLKSRIQEDANECAN